MGEGEEERIGSVWGGDAAFLHLVLCFQLQLAIGAGFQLWSDQILIEHLVFWVYGAAIHQPLAARLPDFHALVQTAGVGAFAGKPDQPPVAVPCLADGIEPRAMAAIDEDGIGPQLFLIAQDMLGHDHVIVVFLKGGQQFGIEPLTEIDDEFVLAGPGRVDADDLWRKVILIGAQMHLGGGVHQIGRDILMAGAGWEHASDPYLGDVAVFAIFLDELFKKRLVCAFDRAAVDLAGVPEFAIFAKAFAKAADIARGVAKGHPDDDGLLVGQRAFGHFPDDIGDVRGLIHQEQDDVALVMQPGKGLCVVFGPCVEIQPPIVLVALVLGFDGQRGIFEPVGGDGRFEPFGDFGAGLGGQLVAGIGRDHHLGIGIAGHGPIGEHAHLRRFADAMARCNGDL